MAILTTSGRTALAASVAAQPLHLAWGAGSPAWDTTPVAETIGLTALTAELGRRVVDEIKFVTPDVAGAISVPNGRFTALPAGQKSNNLYLRFNFEYLDASTASIREVGVFIGTIIKPAVITAEPGRRYFAPADLQDPGILLAVQRTARIIRSAQTRQAVELVVVF
jgi:hypothetical protein